MKTCLFLLVVIVLFTVEALAENCTTPNNEEAECVSLYSCAVLTKALGTHDDVSIEFVRKSNCGGTALEPMVCCGSLSNFSTPNSMAKSSNDVKNKLLPDRRYCGYQHSDDYNHTEHIAAISEFPWLAALVYKVDKKWAPLPLASGTLISNKYVLTAAQCVHLRGRPDIKLEAVRLGEYNIRNQTDCEDEHSIWHECSEPPQDHVISKSIIHPQYTEKNHLNDIALLRLERSVAYSDYIRPICLPTPEIKSTEIGDILTSTGWGRKTSHGHQTPIKKRILARLISNKECVATGGQYEAEVTENKFCTRELDSHTDPSCAGDNGGPVATSSRNQWQQEGIVGFVMGCHEGFPIVSTKVGSYLDWIKENIEP